MAEFLSGNAAQGQGRNGFPSLKAHAALAAAPSPCTIALSDDTGHLAEPQMKTPSILVSRGCRGIDFREEAVAVNLQTEHSGKLYVIVIGNKRRTQDDKIAIESSSSSH